ncbi:arabinosyltransferase domain-containing protein [Antrihabitans cavernicola]|uniref:Arabinosyltransferase n=1 Tax=Antrihabitans cavernicola TaxID=2495913 RepID=A0A5A7SGD0_9NOCA|nr:arabinosyltransferase domain-containing protein [Spelaeibacter cavernicola]KAA0024634.1 arabinosyltransferase [Spelaeibacter cavernicola]
MPPEQPAVTRSRVVRLVAIVAGLLGFVLALATPLLPVRQDAAHIDWPQQGAVSVEAPLVSYTPIQFDATIPAAAARDLGADGGVLLSTVPKQSSEASSDGLVVKVEGGNVNVVLRDIPLLSAPLTALRDSSRIVVTSTVAHTAAEITDTTPDPVKADVARDIRPQMVGIFTDLKTVPAGATAHVDLDSRFSSSPSALKLAAMIVAVLSTLVALVALHLLDGVDRRKPRRFLPASWWKVTPVDGVVVGTLLVWHVIGANTSDDGYLLNMARLSDHSGYMANYYRWFGVPEAPFGWYYDVLAAFAKVSTASPWMRLPALVAAILCWMLISREVLPRLGARVKSNKVALWTAGLVFLAFWLPYNNGLRPEPIIALGALLTWCSIERAIATGRLLPAAVAVLIAAFSLAAGPSGLICIAALIAGSQPVLRAIIARARTVGFASLIAPGLAAGTVVLVAIFADQTLATVLESTRVRTAIGPNVKWFDERVRWDALLTIGPDGSLARRFGVFVMLLCLVVCTAQLLRKGGRIPGASKGPATRILGIIFGSLLLMMFTPTKWTHHFGVYAGLAGSLAALAAVAVGSASIRSPRNRTLFAAAVMFLLAQSFTSSNGWWYVGSYGVPWWDKPPTIAGKGFATILLGLTILLLLLAAWHHYRAPYIKQRNNSRPARMRRIAPAPLTIAAGAVVVFEVLSFAKGAVAQYPAYSIARSNIDALTGNICGLANDVMVETDPNADMLKPLVGSVGDGLSGDSTNFTPNGVANDLTADAEEKSKGGANSIATDSSTTTSTTGAGTGGGTEDQGGVNGSRVMLPFGLDPARTPVMGSYQTGEQKTAKLTTQWYGLTRSGPILVVTAAGRINSVDKDGVVTYGQDLKVEYGTRNPDGSVAVHGSVPPLDIGPSPSWRNLRVPLDRIPPDANAVRLVAVDNDITQRQWLAVTPPRVPVMKTLDDVVGRTDPVLLDWSVGLAFPCQRPFDHLYGVAEVPKYRILPDRNGADSTNAWQDAIGGGPLGWMPDLLASETVPAYSKDDWGRDWGSLERLTPLDKSAVPAKVDVVETGRSGLWTPGPIKEK